MCERYRPIHLVQLNKLFMEDRAVKEKRSLLKNISASWDIISLGGNVLKFRGG